MLRFLGVGAPPAPGLTVAVWCTDPAAPWLGPHGWQSTEHYFRPESAEAQGQDVVLVVGREIVDNIADFTVVEIQLPEQGVRGAVSWQDVTRGYAPENATGPRAKPVTETHSAPPPPPPPPPPASLKLAFDATPSRRIVLRPMGAVPPGMKVPESLGPDDRLGGLAFAELAQRFQGRAELIEDGTARVLEASAAGAPQRLRFRAEPGGALALEGQEGHPYRARVEAGQPVFGVGRDALDKAGEGELLLEPATLQATLVAAPAPPPIPSPRRSIWPLVAAALLLAVGAGGAYWYYAHQPAPPPAPVETPPVTTPPVAEETPEQQLAKARAAIEAGDVETARPILRRLDTARYAPAQLYWAELVDSVDFQPGLLREPDDLRAVDLYAAACAGGAAEAKQKLGELAQSLEARANSGDGLAGELLRGPLRDIRDKCP